MRIALALLLVGGCFSTTGGTVSIARTPLNLLPTMVAKRSDVPLYIVARPADVPDRVHVDGMQFAIFNVSPVDLTEVRSFVTRDLPRALSPWFSTVKVVEDAS